MKKIFFLSFLLIPATVYCMETMETKGLDLSKMTRSERQEAILQRPKFITTPGIEIAYYQENHHPDFVKKNQTKLQNINFDGYSAIGIAAIAIKVYSLPDPHKEIFDEALYSDKKSFIQQLRNCGIKPTEKDRLLAWKVELEAGIKHFHTQSGLLGE